MELKEYQIATDGISLNVTELGSGPLTLPQSQVSLL